MYMRQKIGSPDHPEGKAKDYESKDQWSQKDHMTLYVYMGLDVQVFVFIYLFSCTKQTSTFQVVSV